MRCWVFAVNVVASVGTWVPRVCKKLQASKMQNKEMAMNPDQYPSTADFESANTLGKTASPLLAGFSMSLIGVVVGIDSINKIKYPDFGLVLLVLAAVSFVLAVQFTVHFSQYFLSEDEHKRRTPGLADAARANAYKCAMINYHSWANCSRLSFDCGIGFLSFGICIMLLPPNPSCLRIFAVVLSFLFFACEIVWCTIDFRKSKKFIKSLESTQG